MLRIGIVQVATLCSKNFILDNALLHFHNKQLICILSYLNNQLEYI